MPNKSKIIEGVDIPHVFFFDFLRGLLDGDGSIYFYYDQRWKSSFMFYICFASGSKEHILWLQKTIYEHINIKGHITGTGKARAYQLKYAKMDSLKLFNYMYHDENVFCLARKRLQIDEILCIVASRQKDDVK